MFAAKGSGHQCERTERRGSVENGEVLALRGTATAETRVGAGLDNPRGYRW